MIPSSLLKQPPLSTTTKPTAQIISIATNRKFQSSSKTQQSQQEEEMKDEYGEMTADGESYIEKDFVLENSVVLPEAELRYQTYGQLNDAKDNVIVVCHALTGNASLHSWWGDLLGDNKAFDTSKYLIVCCNILGSCYGSTNPQSINPATNSPYGKSFPDVSVKDTVKLQLNLIKHELGASSIKCVIGGSFGGMQTMEFAVQGGITGGEFVTEDGKHNSVF
jgi:homoserine O-acetyltransferase